MNGRNVKKFNSLYNHGFVRVAACTPVIALAAPAENAVHIVEQLNVAQKEGVALCVFPELVVSGYSIEDLLFQEPLLKGVEEALETIRQATVDLTPVCVVGAPLRYGVGLYNCAVVLHRGRILGVVPKSFLPNYREFYEGRHFATGVGIKKASVRINHQEVPFGIDLLFQADDVPDMVLGIEICEDLWVPISPGTLSALAGATVIANPSASNITVAKAEVRDMLCRSQSLKNICAYVYSAAGAGESTTDVAWDGQATIFEYGTKLASGTRFPTQPSMVMADIDLGLLQQERRQMVTFDHNRIAHAVAYEDFRTISFTLSPEYKDFGLKRAVPRFPFVPNEAARLEQDCYEAYTIQVEALIQRLKNSGARTMVIGVSGGLDSTQALLVMAQAADRLGWDRQQIKAYTMPGFGTSTGTLENAQALMASLQVSADILDIRPTAELMLKEIKHPYAEGKPVYDITFENVQAGLRTDYLFRLANQFNGLVIGTGDLSELALGWCTYGVGDQMSHYAVNAGLPKTLIQHLIRWVVSSQDFPQDVGRVLLSILETEISPELLPIGGDQPLQSTEEKIGPYALQDFNLFYTLRYGFSPSKIAFLAQIAWHDKTQGDWPSGYPDAKKIEYDLATIRQWLVVFVRRFFGFSQFKRSALPNGPKIIAGGALSPRGDWRAPSDGNARIWLAEIERNIPTNQ
ncbi:NAD(+) synthase [Entomobacter blattae]|uniref:Glutamine-dependent NAD(+) synthetase n=1 Tax=Entomobacter blattae TaxID=2762277 RepID=A0A7H1NQ77_9PROT|nr:NAD(+) synthase [Entomobacter blattae]QNT77937.1 Glutamine-dependent NAD(+) synthetase [Entomobacter blattae]